MIWTPKDNSFCYIGSTFNRLHKRFEGHKSQYKSKYGEITIHKYFDTYGVDNFKIDLIKSYNVVREHKMDFKHLHAYETLWISKTKNCINKLLPFNPFKKLSRKIGNENYYQKNKDNIKDKVKKNQEQNKEQNKEQYKDKIKERNKNYYQKNKDKVKDRTKKNQEQNKEQQNKKFECECGGRYTFCNKAQHLKSKKHINYINNLGITI